LATVLLRLSVARFATYPTNIVIWLLFCSGLWYFMNGLLLVADVNCLSWGPASGPRPSQLFNRIGLCAASHWFFLWYHLTWAVSWSAMVLHAAVLVVLKRNLFNRVSQVVTYSLILLLPVIGATTVAGHGSVNGSYLPWCIEPTNTPTWVVMLFFLIPLLFCMVVCLVAISIIFVMMARVTETVSQWHILHNLRLLLFLILGLFSTSMLFSFRFLYYGALANLGGNLVASLNRAQAEFWNCLLFSEACSMTGTQINAGFYVAYVVVLNFAPSLACFVFLSQPELWKFGSDRVWPWKGLLGFASVNGGESAATSTTAGSSSSVSDSGSTFMSDLS
jgi:hypothetical protein